MTNSVLDFAFFLSEQDEIVNFCKGPQKHKSCKPFVTIRQTVSNIDDQSMKCDGRR